MISKRVPREKGQQSNVALLVKYIVNANGQEDPRSWERTADYILDTEAEKNGQGEKVSAVRVTNLDGIEDPALATMIIQATQDQNTRTQADKTYHLVFSFPPGEMPSQAILNDCEDGLVKAMGLEKHQRISAVHVDTDHLHVHVAINLIDPDDYTIKEPFQDMPKRAAACEALELKHGLTRTDHGLSAKKKAQIERKHLKDIRNELRFDQNTELDGRTLRIARDIGSRGGSPTAGNGMHNLSGRRLVGISERTSLLLQNDSLNRTFAGRGNPDHSVRREGPSDSRIHGRAGVAASIVSIEKQSGIETLASFIAENVGPALNKAGSWKEVHEALAAHGLEIKPRGAGMVMGSAEAGFVAAGKVARNLSKGPLERRLGGFVAKGQATTPTAEKYAPRPVQKHPSSSRLFEEWKNQQEGNSERLKAKLEAIKQQDTAYRAKLARWKKAEMAKAKLGRGLGKRQAFERIFMAHKQALASHKNVIRGNKKAAYDSCKRRGWNDWLVYRAQHADTEALAVLRAREERKAADNASILTTKNPEQSRNYVMKNISPKIGKDGAVRYKVDDGFIIDSKSRIETRTDSSRAALISLELARNKFPGQKLVINGSDEFKSTCAEVAAIYKLDVVFEDSALEEKRQAAISEPLEKASDNKQTSRTEPVIQEAKEATPLESFIKERNNSKGAIPHREFKSGDRGRVIFQGIRNIDDGSKVALFEKEGEMLVKGVTTKQALFFKRKAKVGKRVSITSKGALKDLDQGIEM